MKGYRATFPRKLRRAVDLPAQAVLWRASARRIDRIPLHSSLGLKPLLPEPVPLAIQPAYVERVETYLQQDERGWTDKSHLILRTTGRMFHAALDGIIEGHSVIDLAGSWGYYGLLLRKWGAASVLNIDGRAAYGEIFAQVAAAAQVAENSKFESLDVDRDLEALDASASVVLACGIMYHLSDHYRFLANCYRLTEPGGTLVIRTLVSPHPNHASLVREIADYPGASLRPFAYRPAWNALLEMLERVGYSTVRLVTQAEGKVPHSVMLVAQRPAAGA